MCRRAKAGAGRVVSFLLQGSFLTHERVRIWSVMLLVATVAAVAWLAFTSHGGNDYLNRPLGTDFSDVYAAGQLAHHGVPAAAYDPVRHHHQEQVNFGPQTPFYGWHYPPFFLVIADALAHLPYIPALVIWQLLTGAAYLVAMRALLRNGPAPELAKDPVWLLVALAFPAVFVNVTHGQNAFLTAALMAGALVLLDRRPVMAGILFGLMAYKPQFGILIPLVLLAGKHWKTFAAATVTVLALAALATACFGTEIWPAFLGSTQFSRTVVLELGGTGFEKIQSVFSAARFLGGSVAFAYGVQAIMTASVAVALVVLWRGPASAAVKGAGLCLGALLSTPYCLDYDLMLLAPALALLASEGRVRGFREGELLILSALWLLPLFARGFASATHLLVAPVLMAICLFLVVRRAQT